MQSMNFFGQSNYDEQYVVCFQRKDIFYINRRNGEVHIYDNDMMPFDIFLEESDDFTDRLNNIQNFNTWCSERMLSIDRKYAKEICNYFNIPQRTSDSERALITIAFRGLTINDCFWIKHFGETITWEEVNLYDNSLKENVLEVALTGFSPTITNEELITPDVSTAGKAPKAWRRTANGFELLKGDVCGSVKREVEASQILNKIGISTVFYRKGLFKLNPVSICDCFTTKHLCFARAGYMGIWCMNHDSEIADLVFKYKKQFDLMNIADYLVGNSDKHSENWGFLYSDDFEIVGISPIMDFDHAFEAGPSFLCQPATFIGVNTSQESYALSVIKDYASDIDFDISLDEFEYGSFVKGRLKVLREVIS